jgi:hypothetical protein
LAQRQWCSGIESRDVRKPATLPAGVHHIRELAVEARERRTMHRLRWDQLAVGRLPCEGRHGVGTEDDVMGAAGGE